MSDAMGGRADRERDKLVVSVLSAVVGACVATYASQYWLRKAADAFLSPARSSSAGMFPLAWAVAPWVVGFLAFLFVRRNGSIPRTRLLVASIVFLVVAQLAALSTLEIGIGRTDPEGG